MLQEIGLRETFRTGPPFENDREEQVVCATIGSLQQAEQPVQTLRPVSCGTSCALAIERAFCAADDVNLSALPARKFKRSRFRKLRLLIAPYQLKSFLGGHSGVKRGFMGNLASK
jgi:hypothetical protein